MIRLVEQSPLPAKATVAKLGIPRATFYRWYDRYRGSSWAVARKGKTYKKLEKSMISRHLGR